MAYIKSAVVLTVASLLVAAPAFAQSPDSGMSSTPTGRSDSDSSGMKKPGATGNGGAMNKSNMQPSANPNGTSTLGGPAGKMSDPANK